MSSNSLVSFLQGRLADVFDDISWSYSHRREWARDKQRLIHELEYHGTYVVTMALPALGKHFDRCLSRGLYSLPNLPLSGGRGKRNGFQALCQDLLLQIFDEEQRLRVDASVEAIAAMRQLYYCFKKLKLQCPQRAVNEEVHSFLVVENETRGHTLGWDYDELDISRSRDVHFRDALPCRDDQLHFQFDDVTNTVSTAAAELLQHVADRFAAQLGDLHKEEASELPRHGPGVVANLRKGQSKYSFPMWSHKLDAIFPHDLYARTDFGVGQDHEATQLWGRGESPSRLIAVPKTQKGPRLIAAEPVEHQWVQQLIWNQLENRLSQTFLRSSIHFRSQTVSREWAMKGSKTGLLATIDLSAASDRLSCWAVERFFRANLTLLERLHASRTRWIANRVTNHSWAYLKLKKFAPMGSAATFPLQTICYAIVGVSAILLSRGLRVTNQNLRMASAEICVFGDDIIVPKDACEYVVQLLSYLGLKVNSDKTHMEGNFRESCGMDAFRGYDVTPAYFQSPAATADVGSLASHVEVSNNFFMKGMWRTADGLLSSLSNFRHLLPVVDAKSTQLGVKSFCGAELRHLKRRYNHDLQQDEVRVVKPTTKQAAIFTPGSYLLAQYLLAPGRRDFLGNVPKRVLGTLDRPVVNARPGWSPTQIYFES